MSLVFTVKIGLSLRPSLHPLLCPSSLVPAIELACSFQLPGSLQPLSKSSRSILTFNPHFSIPVTLQLSSFGPDPKLCSSLRPQIEPSISTQVSKFRSSLRLPFESTASSSVFKLRAIVRPSLKLRSSAPAAKSGSSFQLGSGLRPPSKPSRFVPGLNLVHSRDSVPIQPLSFLPAFNLLRPSAFKTRSSPAPNLEF